MVRRRRHQQKDLSLLLHPLRRDIYRLVCENPGSYFFEIASTLTAPHGTISWHIRKLEQAGLIQSMKFGGKRVYFPKNLRPEEVEKAFVVLKHPTARKIFAYILNNPDSHQSQIAKELNLHHDTVRHHTSRMEQVQLVESYKSGRKTCYRLGPVGKKLQDESVNSISSSYVGVLLDILEDNCLHPEIEELTPEHLTLRIECPGTEDTTLSISLSQWDFAEFTPDEEENEEQKYTNQRKTAEEET